MQKVFQYLSRVPRIKLVDQFSFIALAASLLVARRANIRWATYRFSDLVKTVNRIVVALPRGQSTISADCYLIAGPSSRYFHNPLSPGKTWWSRAGSNRRPPRCERGALPTELRPQALAC